jgi:hypothetical protein
MTRTGLCACPCSPSGDAAAKSYFLLWTFVVCFGYDRTERVAERIMEVARTGQDSRRACIRPAIRLPLRDSHPASARHDADNPAPAQRKCRSHRTGGSRWNHTYNGCSADRLLHSACILLASTTIRGDARSPRRTPSSPFHTRRRPPPLDRDGGAGYVIASPRRQPATPCPPR